MCIRDRALGESQHSGGRGSFLVTQENQVIGPLGEENAIAYTGSPNHKAEVLSRLLSMSPLAVQKILSVLEKLGRDQLTSQELAEYLGLTQRSASRLLGQITQRGGAQEVLSDGPSRRGRPQKDVYKRQVQSDHLFRPQFINLSQVLDTDYGFQDDPPPHNTKRSSLTIVHRAFTITASICNIF